MEKIDFVIAWVDGSDPAWQAQKAKYRNDPETGDAQVRYRDWDTLRYWFRGAEKYAPWVNRIHLLTWGHVPSWLNTEHPKVHVVNHADFIPEAYLPTFSSHPIELNMHRIPGLAEQFVYFNDDFFLTAPVKPSDFFVKGRPCDSLEENPLTLNWRDMMVSVNANDVLFLNRHHSKPSCRRGNLSRWYSLRTPMVAWKNLLLTPISRSSFFGLNHHHLPQAYRKENLAAVWAMDDGWLAETCSHRFRDPSDVSQCVFKFHQLATGDFHPYNKRKYGKWFRGSQYKDAARAISRKEYKFICCNDAPSVDFAEAKAVLHRAFDSVLPEKSGYEK